MTHEQAEQQHAAESYVLGELDGEGRAAFEEHLFGCLQCAADVKDGALLLRGAQQQFLREEGRSAASAGRERSRRVWPFAAIAASLLAVALASVVGYQSLVKIPSLHQQLAKAEAPSVLHELILAGSGARGGSATPSVRLSPKESLLLTVDVPAMPMYGRYRCSLSSAGGKLLWQLEIAPAVAETAVPLRVPAERLNEGENVLRIEGLSPQGATGSVSPADLATYRFHVVFER